MSGEREKRCSACNGTGQICTTCHKSEAKCLCRFNPPVDEAGEELAVEYDDCSKCNGRGSV